MISSTNESPLSQAAYQEQRLETAPKTPQEAMIAALIQSSEVFEKASRSVEIAIKQRKVEIEQRREQLDMQFVSNKQLLDQAIQQNQDLAVVQQQKTDVIQQRISDLNQKLQEARKRVAELEAGCKDLTSHAHTLQQQVNHLNSQAGKVERIKAHKQACQEQQRRQQEETRRLLASIPYPKDKTDEANTR